MSGMQTCFCTEHRNPENRKQQYLRAHPFRNGINRGSCARCKKPIASKSYEYCTPCAVFLVKCAFCGEKGRVTISLVPPQTGAAFRPVGNTTR